MSAVSIDRLSHQLADGTSVVVDDFRVETGERLVLFGPNGAGKTSLLRLLAGTIGSAPLFPAAYLPQRPVMFRGSGRWNLFLGLDEQGRRRATELASALGLDATLLDRPARRLSGGERQRLALARVLARPEAVLLLDEPLAPLDARDRQSVTGKIAEELQGRTAVIVTHDQRTAAALGDRMAVMVGGRIRQTGTPSEVFALPADDAVAEAVGVGNLLEGEVSEVAGHLVGLKSGPLVVWGIGAGAEGSNGRALFAAETVTVFGGHRADAGSARNTWNGTVEELRPSGALIEVLIDCGPRIAAVITPGSLGALDLEVGTPVTVAVKAAAVRILAG